MKMWSGRFAEPLDRAFETWQRSYPFDQRLLPHEIAGSRAHARALAKAGVLTNDELTQILSGLQKIGERPPAADSEAEDVHHYVEKELVALIGETGYKLHSGRSRNEQVATDLRLYVRAAIDELRSSLSSLVLAFLARAEDAAGAVMPAYTHLQRAEPVLVSHWLLAYVEMFLRSGERLAQCRSRVNLCPLGSGAVAGATLPLDRRVLAAELGFDGATANSIDATSEREFALEFVQVLSLLALSLSRWAEEMILFSTVEFGFVSLPEAYSTGSSAMPQKKNPDLLELVRGKTARVAGNAVALLVAAKGLPLAYNKDLQETQEPLFDASETLVAALPLVTGFMGSVTFNLPRMRQAAEKGFLNAWAAATYLVERGVPSRLAHEQVGRAVRVSLDKGCELVDLSLDELRSASAAFAPDIYDRLGLDAVVAIHDVPGGTAPGRVLVALREARNRAHSLLENHAGS